MPGKPGDGFKPGDLVFAKMKGFPHWPARSDSGYKKRVPVFFFGTHQMCSIPPENVVPYFGNKMKYGSGVRIKGFSEGMWEIQNTPGVGSKGKVSVSRPPSRVQYPVGRFPH
uniref:PWWP domain-containing protein n=1 Tax=Scophthalmus maximus TaxID=52904 RepID=A0A8D3B453_SCOMX